MKQLSPVLAAAIVAAPVCATADDGQNTAATEFKMHPIGHVKKSKDQALIVLDKEFQPGLLGLDCFSHVYVFWWFNKNDTPDGRAVLQVHPRGNRKNPLTGVFATRSPRRPNLIAMTLCKVVAVKENVVEVEKIDAFDGTPVIDMKPYLPGYDTADDAKVPDWVGGRQRKPNQ
jgi:tRNA-Thr(GGU) m(6)t(6)A37 methyltransferase TsaA